MVGHSLRNMHVGAYMIAANVGQHELIPKINFTWDRKILDPYLPVKDLDMAIQK
jgi:hypothetical protein